MTRQVRFAIRPRPPTQTGEGGFIVQPRWRLIFQDQQVDERVTEARDDRAGTVRHLAVSFKGHVVNLSRCVMYPVRRTG